ncbi:MAG: hypothetical protein ACREOO_06965 [bacterium]
MLKNFLKIAFSNPFLAILLLILGVSWRDRLLLPLFAFLFALQVTFAQAQWLQWGGPNRNFRSESKGLATSWPASGPRELWSRALGEGHSSIIVDSDRLYTMYRPAGLLSNFNVPVMKEGIERIVHGLEE